MEGSIAGCPIRQARRVRPHDARDHEDPGDHKDDDDDDLYGGQPELGLTVDTRRQGVEADDNHQEHDGPNPRGHGREPVSHHQTGRHQVRGHRHRPVKPVVPPHGESERRGDELRGKSLEGASDRLVGAHLAQGLHEEQHHEADRRVSEEGAARAGVRDRRTGSQEQASADRTTDGNHLHVARRQASLELCVGALTDVVSNVIGSGGVHEAVPHLSIVPPNSSPKILCHGWNVLSLIFTRPWMGHACQLQTGAHITAESQHFLRNVRR